VAKIYDLEISMLLPDGRFNPKAADVLKDSFVDLGILPERPKDDREPPHLDPRSVVIKAGPKQATAGLAT